MNPRTSSGEADPVGRKHGRAKPLRPLELLTVFLGLALLAAFSQLALLAYWKFKSGYNVQLGLDAVWKTPVAVTAVYAVPVVLLYLLSKRWRRLASLPAVVSLLALLAVIDLSLMERHLTLWAVGLLALGVGMQAGRIAEAHKEAFMRLARVAAMGLVLTVVLGTLIVEVGGTVREKRLEGALPPARAGAPNILFIILDTVRALNLGLYGYFRDTTPVLDSLAAGATVFDRAIVPGTWSVPSHRSMLTGRWPHELEGWRRDGRSPHPTVAEVLAGHGYRTGGFVANWFSLDRESGLGQGFQHYDDYGHSLGQIARGSAMVRWFASRRRLRRAIGLYDSLGRRHAPEITRDLLGWLKDGSGRPYFAFVNYLDAHSPYLPPPPFDRWFGVDVSGREPVVMEELNRGDELSDAAAYIETAAYDGSIAYLDSHLRFLLDALIEAGALDNTVVIVAADHGEELGENGIWGHAAGLSTQSVLVPLVLWGPGIPEGLRVTEPVSLRGIASTIADLAGIGSSALGGRSLAPFWRSPGSPPADTVVTEMGYRRAVVLDRYHFIQAGNGEGPRLYDLTGDPAERRNLFGTELADSVLPALRDVLATFPARPGEGAESATAGS